MLVAILKPTEEPLVLQVALHDLGQIAQYHARGKEIINQLGGKTRIMALLVRALGCLLLLAAACCQHR